MRAICIMAQNSANVKRDMSGKKTEQENALLATVVSMVGATLKIAENFVNVTKAMKWIIIRNRNVDHVTVVMEVFATTSWETYSVRVNLGFVYLILKSVKNAIADQIL